jgi:hypothetical protein
MVTIGKQISYAEFGHNFIHQVVTARRIGTEIESALNSTIAGSIRKLPAELFVVSYVFALKDIRVDPNLAKLPDISFLLAVQGSLKLDVEIFGLSLRYALDVSIAITIDVETYEPVMLRLVPHVVTSKNVNIDLVGENPPSEVLDKMKLVHPIVRDQIIKEVNSRIQDPAIISLCTIDVLALVENASDSAGEPEADIFPLQDPAEELNNILDLRLPKDR